MTDLALTILLVEDDPDVLEATTLLLESEGFPVLAASDLSSARLLAQECSHRCLTLLDLSIEGDLEGFIAELRELPERAGPVLLFSAGEGLRARAESLGADGWVPKPFDFDQLVLRLRDHQHQASSFTAE